MVQLQLGFNDRLHTFSDDCQKVNFAISYLKGIVLAHFENSLIEPDFICPTGKMIIIQIWITYNLAPYVYIILAKIIVILLS